MYNRSCSLFVTYASAFPVIFIDQFGVLHDGRQPYPGAIQALRTLKQRGACVIIFSNSGRSGKTNAARMAELGFPAELYDHFVTSGDAAKSALTLGEIPVTLSPSLRCMNISSSQTHDLADELGLVSTTHPEQAELLLITGIPGNEMTFEAYEHLLTSMAARGVPCLCTNPDKITFGNGALFPGAGALASIYEKLGGKVSWIGKPYGAIYDYAAQLCGSPACSDILCVGDSVEHDIVGARNFGASAALIRTGILADLSESELASTCASFGVMPDIILRTL